MELKTCCNICEESGKDNYELLYLLEDYKVMRCKYCGLVWVDVPYNENVLKQSDYYWAEGIYQSEAALLRRWFRDEVKRIERYTSGKCLLDIGCGFGYLLEEAKKEGFEVAGVEISQKVVSKYLAGKGLNVWCGRLEEAGFKAGSFDVITMFDLIEHLQNPIGTLKLVHNILKKDGLLVIETPREESLFKMVAHIIYKMSKGRITYPLKSAYHSHPGGHKYGFSHKSITMLLETSGFSILKIERRMIIFKVFLREIVRKKNLIGFLTVVFPSILLWFISYLIDVENRMVVYARKGISRGD